MNDRELLKEGRFLDAAILLVLATRLLKSFKKWDAYQLGIIDEKGNKLREPENGKEKDAWSLLNRFIAKLKRSLSNKIIAGLAIYYTLIKEERKRDIPSVQELQEDIRDRKKLDRINEKIDDLLLKEGITRDVYWSYIIDKSLDEIDNISIEECD